MRLRTSCFGISGRALSMGDGFRRLSILAVAVGLAVASGCGGGTGTGGSFGSAETLTFEGWDSYRGSSDPLDLAEAERLFSNAISLDPSFSEAHNGLGWLNLQRAGQESGSEERSRLLERARTNYQRAIAADPQNEDAWAGLAGLELAANNWVAARDAANRALEINPQYFSSHDNVDFRDLHIVLAQSFFHLGNFIETPSTLDPNNSLFHLDFLEPGFKEVYLETEPPLTPPDLILKIEELQSR